MEDLRDHLTALRELKSYTSEILHDTNHLPDQQHLQVSQVDQRLLTIIDDLEEYLADERKKLGGQ